MASTQVPAGRDDEARWSCARSVQTTMSLLSALNVAWRQLTRGEGAGGYSAKWLILAAMMKSLRVRPSAVCVKNFNDTLFHELWMSG
jgi:hypothetical protein